jgi:hypothetical protein
LDGSQFSIVLSISDRTSSSFFRGKQELTGLRSELVEGNAGKIPPSILRVFRITAFSTSYIDEKPESERTLVATLGLEMAIMDLNEEPIRARNQPHNQTNTEKKKKKINFLNGAESSPAFFSGDFVAEVKSWNHHSQR